jgi:hypothetical protein
MVPLDDSNGELEVSVDSDGDGDVRDDEDLTGFELSSSPEDRPK